MPPYTSQRPHYEERRAILLRILQNTGGTMSTQELHQEAQRRRDTAYSIRTTRRDLEALQKIFYVTKSEGPLPRLHYWKLGRSSFELRLSPTESITLTAIFQHAERFGFSFATEQLVDLRNYAATEIDKHATRNLLAEGRIRTGTRFTVLKPGRYQSEHLTTIQTALLENTALKVVYRPRDAANIECTYLLKPLALSYQDSNIYLSAYIDSEVWPDGHKPTTDTARGKYSSNGPGTTCALMLHRMVSVDSAWQDIAEPSNYDASSIAAQKDLITIHASEAIDLQLRLSPNLYNRLNENPLTDNQSLSQDEAGWLLECQLLDTQGLRLFLLSNAADIEVLAPQQLRNNIRNTLESALQMYQRDE